LRSRFSAAGRVVTGSHWRKLDSPNSIANAETLRAKAAGPCIIYRQLITRRSSRKRKHKKIHARRSRSPIAAGNFLRSRSVDHSANAEKISRDLSIIPTLSLSLSLSLSMHSSRDRTSCATFAQRARVKGREIGLSRGPEFKFTLDGEQIRRNRPTRGRCRAGRGGGR